MHKTQESQSRLVSNYNMQQHLCKQFPKCLSLQLCIQFSLQRHFSLLRACLHFNTMQRRRGQSGPLSIRTLLNCINARKGNLLPELGLSREGSTQCCFPFSRFYLLKVHRSLTRHKACQCCRNFPFVLRAKTSFFSKLNVQSSSNASNSRLQKVERPQRGRSVYNATHLF